MRLVPRVLIVLLTCACLVALGTGCVARKVAYGFLDTIVYRSVDGYFDVDAKQKVFLKEKIAALTAWHASEELPRYVEALRALEARAVDGLDRKDIDWTYATFDAGRERIVARSMPDVLAFLQTVKPSQVDAMEEANAERNAKRKKVTALEPGAYAEKRADDLEKSMREWIGPLTAPQRAKVEAFTRAGRQADIERFAATKASQVRLAATLRENDRKTAAQDSGPDSLREVLTSGMRPLLPEANPYQAKLRDLFVEIAGLATPDQRSHFLKEVRSWRADFEELDAKHRAR